MGIRVPSWQVLKDFQASEQPVVCVTVSTAPVPNVTADFLSSGAGPNLRTSCSRNPISNIPYLCSESRFKSVLGGRSLISLLSLCFPVYKVQVLELVSRVMGGHLEVPCRLSHADS